MAGQPELGPGVEPFDVNVIVVSAGAIPCEGDLSAVGREGRLCLGAGKTGEEDYLRRGDRCPVEAPGSTKPSVSLEGRPGRKQRDDGQRNQEPPLVAYDLA